MYTKHYIVYIKHEHRNDGQLVTDLWDLMSEVSRTPFSYPIPILHKLADLLLKQNLIIFLKPNGPNASPVALPHSGRGPLLQIWSFSCLVGRGTTNRA